MKNSIRYAFLVFVSLLPCAGMAEKSKEVPRIVQYQENLKKDMQTEDELCRRMIEMISEMVTVVKDFDAASQSMAGISGLGRIEQLQFRAERYSAERQVRKRIEKDIIELAEVVQQWQDAQGRVKNWRRLLEMEKRVIAIKHEAEKTPEGKPATPARDMENVTYYTVRNSAPLKEISALPEVYGNETAWRYLYDANRDKVSHPNAVVQAGVTLTIPNIEEKSTFINLD